MWRNKAGYLLKVILESPEKIGTSCGGDNYCVAPTPMTDPHVPNASVLLLDKEQNGNMPWSET
jgi:hypothetical protein